MTASAASPPSRCPRASAPGSACWCARGSDQFHPTERETVGRLRSSSRRGAMRRAGGVDHPLLAQHAPGGHGVLVLLALRGLLLPDPAEPRLPDGLSRSVSSSPWQPDHPAHRRRLIRLRPYIFKARRDRARPSRIAVPPSWCSPISASRCCRCCALLSPTSCCGRWSAGSALPCGWCSNRRARWRRPRSGSSRSGPGATPPSSPAASPGSSSAIRRPANVSTRSCASSGSCSNPTISASISTPSSCTGWPIPGGGSATCPSRAGICSGRRSKRAPRAVCCRPEAAPDGWCSPPPSAARHRVHRARSRSAACSSRRLSPARANGSSRPTRGIARSRSRNRLSE